MRTRTRVLRLVAAAVGLLVPFTGSANAAPPGGWIAIASTTAGGFLDTVKSGWFAGTVHVFVPGWATTADVWELGTERHLGPQGRFYQQIHHVSGGCLGHTGPHGFLTVTACQWSDNAQWWSAQESFTSDGAVYALAPWDQPTLVITSSGERPVLTPRVGTHGSAAQRFIMRHLVS